MNRLAYSAFGVFACLSRVLAAACPSARVTIRPPMLHTPRAKSSSVSSGASSGSGVSIFGLSFISVPSARERPAR